MNYPILKRMHFIVLLAAVAGVSLLYQVVKGWNTLDFLLRVVFAMAVVLAMRRGANLAAQAGGGAGTGSAAWAACWVLAALALFVGLMLGA